LIAATEAVVPVSLGLLDCSPSSGTRVFEDRTETGCRSVTELCSRYRVSFTWAIATLGILPTTTVSSPSAPIRVYLTVEERLRKLSLLADYHEVDGKHNVPKWNATNPRQRISMQANYIEIVMGYRSVRESYYGSRKRYRA